MRTNAFVGVLFCSTLILSGCGIEFPDSPFDGKPPKQWIPGVYVDGLLEKTFRDVFAAVVAKQQSTKQFSELSLELLQGAPDSDSDYPKTYSPSASESALTLLPPFIPTPPKPLNWEFTPPNKIAIRYLDTDFVTAFQSAVAAFLENEVGGTAHPPGITISSGINERLATLFEETKNCVGSDKGEFSELAVYLMPKSFPCPPDASTLCAGYYNTVNRVLTNNLSHVARHEYIHYFLWLSTGNADPGHTNDFFNSCVY